MVTPRHTAHSKHFSDIIARVIFPEFEPMDVDSAYIQHEFPPFRSRFPFGHGPSKALS